MVAIVPISPRAGQDRNGNALKLSHSLRHSVHNKQRAVTAGNGRV